VKDRWRGLNTEAEIGIRRGAPDEDPVRTHLGALLERTLGVHMELRGQAEDRLRAVHQRQNDVRNELLPQTAFDRS
jgi:hypothetical protein